MLQHQLIAITGASSGIGAELARLFINEGAKVILLARSTEKLAKIKVELGDRAVFYPLVVSSNDSVRSGFQTIKQQFGPIDVLINNAGIGLFKRVNELEIDQFEQMMNVNYMGMVRCTQQVLPTMQSRRMGQIVNMISMAGKVGTAKSTAYAASKHAMVGFTNSLRLELKGSGITVSAVNPGPVRTPFFAETDPSGAYLSRLPAWFVLSPEQVAQAVLRAVIRKKREVNLPLVAAFFAKCSLLFPSLFDRLASGVLNKK